MIDFLRKSGWPGVFLATVVVLFMATWFPVWINTLSEPQSLMGINKFLATPLLHVDKLAMKNDVWSASSTTLLFFLEVVFPITTIIWFIQALARRFRQPTQKQVISHEQHLKEVMKTVQQLGNRRKNVPPQARQQLILVIKHFEKGIGDIIQIKKRGQFRLIWIVQNDADPSNPTIWTRDRMPTQSEFDAIATGFQSGWFTCLDDVPKNAMFRNVDTGDIETMVCARNLGDWKIGFALLIDRRYSISLEKQMILKAHMGFLMMLGEMDMLRKSMLQFTKEDWKAVVTL